MKHSILITLSILCLNQGFSCINEYITLLSGKVVFSDEPAYGKIYAIELDTVEIRKEANLLLEKYQSSDSLEYLSDYAAKLIYLGNYSEAKSIYFNIEVKRPNLYTTASNLGTIYELIGQPDSALFWIKKSIEINPQSHYGSEWIHIKILEHKLTPNANLSNSILGLNFGSEPIPSNPEDYDLDKIKKHISHQLRERLKFIKPKNEIIGNIYFDFGNIVAQTSNVESALESYEEALIFGFNSELLQKRITKMKSLASNANPYRVKEKIKRNLRGYTHIIGWTIIISFSLFALTVILVIVRRKRKKK